MKKTTARVQHRDSIPSGWLAFKFCNVDFFGFRAEEMEKKWFKVRNERFEYFNSIFDENKKKIKSMRQKATSIYCQVQKAKPFYRFWYNKEEKKLIDEANNLVEQAERLAQLNREVQDSKFFTSYEAHNKIDELLKENGFVLSHVTTRGNECITYTEIWTLEE